MATQKQLHAARLLVAAENKGPQAREAQKALGMRVDEAQFKLAESIAQGEFPTQIAPLVRRRLLNKYNSVPLTHQEFTTRQTVQAINVDEQVNIMTFDDQSNLTSNAGDPFVPGGLPTILPREQYPQIAFTASGKTIRARKIGEGFGIDWEAIVRMRGTNVNLIDNAIDAFGRHAKQQEDIDVYSQLVGATGITAALSGMGYAIPGNPDLTNPTAIATAVGNLLVRQVGGFDQQYEKFALLTSVRNAPIARQTLGAKKITRIPPRTGTGTPSSAAVGTQWEEVIDYGAEIEVIGSKWLTTLWPAIGNGWLLVPVANEDDLPVLTSNYLEGDEEPSFWVKDSNARNYGGGDVNPLTEGDFDSDAILTKVRHVHGANLLWGEAIGFSLGTNV